MSGKILMITLLIIVCSALFNIALCSELSKIVKFFNDSVEIHNKYRTLHDSPPLLLSKDLSRTAQNHARKLARQAKFEQSHNGNGENLFKKTSKYLPVMVKATPEEAIRAWYEENENYDYSKEPNSTEVTAEFLAQFQNKGVTVHNKYRSRHGVRPLILSKQLCSMAQNYANKLAAENKFEHSDSQAGENLYMEYSSGPLPMTSAMAEEAISSWYNEIETYDYSLGPRSPGMTGHFTQVVWKSTKYVGMGIAKSNTHGSVVIVANYLPPGNFIGQFKTNVLRPRVK